MINWQTHTTTTTEWTISINKLPTACNATQRAIEQSRKQNATKTTRRPHSNAHTTTPVRVLFRTCSSLLDGGDTTRQIFIVALRNSSRLCVADDVVVASRLPPAPPPTTTPGIVIIDGTDAMAAAAAVAAVAAIEVVAIFGEVGGVGVRGEVSSSI